MSCESPALSPLRRSTFSVLDGERKKWVMSHSAGAARRSLTCSHFPLWAIEGDQGSLGWAALVRSETVLSHLLQGIKSQILFCSNSMQELLHWTFRFPRRHSLLCMIVKTRVFKGEDGRKLLLCHFDGITLLTWEFKNTCCFSLAVTCLVQFTWKLRRTVSRFCSVLFLLVLKPNESSLCPIWWYGTSKLQPVTVLGALETKITSL